MHRLIVGLALTGLLSSGCAEYSKRLNAPPHGQPVETSDMQGTFVYMTDNALLADMTVSDIHFLPHRAQLSALGEQRLARLVSLMQAYGGTIRFNSSLTDQELIRSRLATVRDFLAEAGVDTTAEVVREDLPGGRGMDAVEVILIKAGEATYTPREGGRPGATTGGTAPTGP